MAEIGSSQTLEDAQELAEPAQATPTILVNTSSLQRLKRMFTASLARFSMIWDAFVAARLGTGCTFHQHTGSTGVPEPLVCHA